MAKSLLEQLPEIVANGRKEAEKILEGIENLRRVTLQTREVVLPAKDSAAQDWITTQKRAAQREVFAPGQASLLANPQPMLGDSTGLPAEDQPWTNRLIYGDNLLAMAALIAGDEHTPTFTRLRYVKDDGLPAFIHLTFWSRPKTRCTWWRPRRSSRPFTPTCSANCGQRWPGATASMT